MSESNINKIQLTNVSLSFGKKKVLKDITLNIKDGESLVVLGISGSGKSVFIKSIFGLLPISKGSIKISDHLVGTKIEQNTRIHNIGVTFQHDALFDGMNVLNNLCFGLIHKCKFSSKKAKEISLKALDTMGFQGNISKLMPSELSGGMRKRVAILRTLVLNPEIVFFDEPTTGLDPINSNKITDIIHEYIQRKSVTSVTITHSIRCANSLADKIAFIDEGRIIWHGTKEELQHTDNRKVIDFLNS